MKEKKETLKKLIKRNEELKPIISKSFQTSKELDSYYQKNKKDYEEYDSNLIQIQQLEYELMTPEEQKRYDKGMLFLKLKAKGEPFDFDEFDDLNG